MEKSIRMPALSPTMEEASLSKWLIEVGDTVEEGDLIAELETDKAAMELEAPTAGTLAKILVPEGTENVAVDTEIAIFTDGEVTVSSSIDEPSSKEADAAPDKPRKEVKQQTKSRVPAAGPAARRLALQLGIDLSTLTGTGKNGRIVKSDVEKVSDKIGLAEIKSTDFQPENRSMVATAPSFDEIDRKTSGTSRLVPMDRMRQTIAKRMSESSQVIPHFPVTIECIVDDLVDMRRKQNALANDDKRNERASLNDFLVRACALSLVDVPSVNVGFAAEGMVQHEHADIAIAVAIDGGLITPIIRSADTKSVVAIAAETSALVQKARQRQLQPEEYEGGTFTVSNLGMFGISSFSSIINSPQGAIMSIGQGVKRAVVRDDAIDVAKQMTVTLSCDHRVMDGVSGAKFLSRFKHYVENPLELLL